MKCITRFPFIILSLLAVFSLNTQANAHVLAEPPSKEEALQIIADYENFRKIHFTIVHIIPGTYREEDGFQRDQVIRIVAYTPSDRNGKIRKLRKYMMFHTDEYGWYLQREETDAQGAYLKIFSQKKGKVRVR